LEEGTSPVLLQYLLGNPWIQNVAFYNERPRWKGFKLSEPHFRPATAAICDAIDALEQKAAVRMYWVKM